MDVGDSFHQILACHKLCAATNWATLQSHEDKLAFAQLKCRSCRYVLRLAMPCFLPSLELQVFSLAWSVKFMSGQVRWLEIFNDPPCSQSAIDV